MKRRLSSILVPIYKLTLIVVVAYSLFLTFYDFSKVGKLGLLLLVGFCGVWYFLTFDWKSVYLSEGQLTVSNFRKRIEIPLSNVDVVEASSWWGLRPRTITLYLKSPSEFGKRIVFVPRLGGLEASEMTEELRQLLAAHR